jgi:hypothetical protein
MKGNSVALFRLASFLVLFCLQQPPSSWLREREDTFVDNIASQHAPLKHLFVDAQYSRNSPLFKEVYEMRQKLLEAEIKSHPDVRYTFFPERRLVPHDSYRFDFPSFEDYRIGIIIDPVFKHIHLVVIFNL